METKRHSLNGSWNLDFTAPGGRRMHTETPVPGNVEPTLVKLGLIEDYMPSDNEYATTPFDAVDDWRYTTCFDAPASRPGWKQQLVFEGIDTIADIYLNGERIGSCMDMHLAYRLDVTGKLKARDNHLEVRIHSSELWARSHCHDAAFTPCEVPSFYDSRTYLRKARHQWGWDNAPRLLTSGIIRPVYLEEVSPRGFQEVYQFTSHVNQDQVFLGTNWVYRTDLACLMDYRIKLTLLDGAETVYEETRPLFFIQGGFRYSLPREQVKLWWPAGFGEPYLYTLRLTMYLGEEVESVYEAPFGIRTLNLEHTPDVGPEGGEFVFRVNNERVYIRGTNWKPLDPLASLADAKTRTCKALEEVKALHCNMIRIWGGGIYEDTPFFDYCDRNGIMVWQDFMFACEFPPSEDWFCDLAAQEARYIVKKLRNHPSLALWCGDNESDDSVGWMNMYSSLRPSDSVVSREILREVVFRTDPYRDYVASSPFVSDANFVQRREGAVMTHFLAEAHLYPKDPRKYGEELRELQSRFIGETGPWVNSTATNPGTFARERERVARLWDEEFSATSSIHQNDGCFVAWRSLGRIWCQAVYGRDFTFAEWKDYAIAINLLCAETYKDVVEYCRALRWEKTGVIWWSLMDMWPQLFNYSVMDYEYNPKLAFHWIRQSQQDFLLAGVRRELEGPVCLYAVNDNLGAHTVAYTITAYDAQGNGRPYLAGEWTQGPNSASLIQELALPAQPELWVIRWTEAGKEYANHVITRTADFEVMKRWTAVIGETGGFLDQILELQ